MRTCLECKHLSVTASRCWSEVPGSDPAEISCSAGKFWSDVEPDSADELRAILFRGRDCDKFKPAELVMAETMVDA